MHYNAFNSTHLHPPVARAVGVARSPSRAVLSIVVQKTVPGTTPESITANVSANAFNLTGQLRRLELREVHDQGAIYYLSDFPIVNAEKLTFVVSVTPSGSKEPQEVKFSKQFFSD
ncbi:MAG: DUF4426 domain-containing protein [Pseudomonadota bacterium]|nr:MAG: DUF4426 domain-containing protein [Pseudomonadota bacterium]